MERIEVLRGPASVLYGQAPVGGIINSVSKRPQEEQASEITVEYGTFDFKQVKFDTTGSVTPDGKWTYRLTGLARDADTQVDYVEDDRYAIAAGDHLSSRRRHHDHPARPFPKGPYGSTAQFFPHIGTIFPNVNGRYISQDRFVGEPGDYYDTDVASGTLLVEHKFNSMFKLKPRIALLRTFTTTTTAPYLPATSTARRWCPSIGIRIRDDASDQVDVHRRHANVQSGHQPRGQVRNRARDPQGARRPRLREFRGAIGPTATPRHNPSTSTTPYTARPCGSEPIAPARTTTASNRIPGGPRGCSIRGPNGHPDGLYVQDQMRLGNWIAVVGARKDWIENAADGSADAEGRRGHVSRRPRCTSSPSA